MLQRLTETVTVGQDGQQAGSDRAMVFGSTLTREQIDALSDDPAELRRQLQDMAGPGSVISVDTFEGQPLPPKSLIKSIRISRDQFAAEIHSAGAPRIEVITQPGTTVLTGTFGGNFYSSATDGTNPLLGRTAPGGSAQFYNSFAGTIVPNKLNFSVYTTGTNAFSTSVQCSAAAGQRRCANSSVRTPNRQVFGFYGINYAVNQDHVIRAQYVPTRQRQRNLGLGEYAQVERAFHTWNDSDVLNISEFGPLGRRSVINLRLSLSRSDNTSSSVFEGPASVILDERTEGGAQRTGGTHHKALMSAVDIDYVRGRHSVRTGVQVDGAWFRSDANSNYLGTYTFETREKFEAGQPRSYTRRTGDPNISYTNVQVAAFVQDDIRLRRNLTISPGVRYEIQSLVPDRVNFGPRFGVTWAPFADGRTTLRASAGHFFDWLPTSTYQETLQVDGFRQREINILNPSYPDPGFVAASPVNRYVLNAGRRMPSNTRVSGGIQRALGRIMLGSLTYSHVRGSGLLVGENLNAPEAGVRPDPAFANVILAVSEGRTRQHNVEANVNVNFAGVGAPLPVPGIGKLIEWRRGLRLVATYTHTRHENDTDGPFSTPATNDLRAEWGPASGEVRHRAFAQLTTWFLRNFTSVLGVTASSAPPLTIRTGLDDNGDLIFNDRPSDVGRNSVRTRGTWNANVNFSYGFTMGRKTVATDGGVTLTGTAASGLTANIVGTQTRPRFRLSFNLGIANFLNRENYAGYSGVLTSQFYRQPTMAYGVRRLTLNTNMVF